jgi:hypothetical protein
MASISYRRRAVRAFALAFAAQGLWTVSATASVSYSMPNLPYSQDFDSLPISPQNASLQATIPWTDDSTSSATQTSIPGWYLYHPIAQATEGGVNQHQRLRVGAGTANTGSFYSFGASGATERALGSVGSNTMSDPPPATTNTDMFVALRLTNNTGQALGKFTLTYTGEQWRDAGNATPAAELLGFSYSLNATSPQDGAATFTSAPELSFTSPVATTTAGSLDGNLAANRTLKSATV